MAARVKVVPISDIKPPELRRMVRKERSGKSRDRLLAAIMQKEDKSQQYIAKHLGRSQSTISAWLSRMEKEGLEGRHDRKKPGRPSRLSAEGQKDVSADLKEEPFKHGFERGTWNAPLLVLHIGKKFGVWYSVSGALALAHRLNFSVRKSRPVHHKTATPEVIKEYVNKTVATIKEHAAAGYTVLCLDAAAVRNTGSSARGIRLRGGRETVSVNFSMVSTTMIGALGVGKHHINFCKSANSANVI